MQNPRLPTSPSPRIGSPQTLAGEKPNRPLASSIGAQVTITGNIEAAVDLHIEGRVIGDVRCDTLYLAETSKISGRIQASRVRVAGIVEGDIEVQDLAVEATAIVKGEVTYSRLRVANGASVEGQLKYEDRKKLDTDEKLGGTSVVAESVANSVHIQSPTKTEGRFTRGHHRLKERGQAMRGQLDIVKQAEISSVVDVRSDPGQNPAESGVTS